MNRKSYIFFIFLCTCFAFSCKKSISTQQVKPVTEAEITNYFSSAWDNVRPSDAPEGLYHKVFDIKNLKKEKEASALFKEKVSVHKLDMKLVDCHYLLKDPKVIFFFTADTRIDFRKLVKDLVAILRLRIELRQIGVRDESRIAGGIGCCGRPFCCHAVTDKLRPVSIKMAKEQNLSLNSLKISGQCGRLLCCLAYEYDWYVETRKKLPSIGTSLYYDNTLFRLSEINLITGIIALSGDDGRVISMPVQRLSQQHGKWKIN